MRNSKYWDDFERRIEETVNYIKHDNILPIRRVACFITNRCNFRCQYCNFKTNKKDMSIHNFKSMLESYGNDAIIHITGGEPSVVPWLYNFISSYSNVYRFHLNTNCFISPPSKHVKRLKVSLDSCNRQYWNNLVGVNAFDVVIENIKKSIPDTVVSITYTMTKQNYMDVIDFAQFCNKEFPGLYAIFFSVYKGIDDRFLFTSNDSEKFFNDIYPELLTVLNNESRYLIMETIDEKKRIINGIRFPENIKQSRCYLSMSERVFSPDGEIFTCSHLYRDNIFMQTPNKHEKCKYGCNRRLVAFNKIVEEKLKK